MAALTFKVGLELRELEKDLLALGERAPMVLARALNRAGTSGKTAVVRAVGSDTGFRQKTLTSELRIAKASRNDLKFTLQVRGRRIPLIEFKARGPEPSRGRGRGVTWTNQGESKNEPHAFIATVGAGHRGVFIRSRYTPRGARYRMRTINGRAVRREVIVQLLGPSIAHVFATHIPVFQQAAQESLLKNLAHEIGFARRPLPAAA